ncbi:hypothetical protein MUTS15_21840 [Escherichia coli]|nr:hypothetical protein MUTS15_21840 [Escherichia coli]
MSDQRAKKAEDRQELILRLFNPAELTSCDATVAFSRKVMTCTETMMNERFNTEKNEVLKELALFYRDSRGHLATE